MTLRCIIILLSVAALFQPLGAQYEHLYESWRWAHFTTKSGLPSNTIDEVVQANDGTMWASTRMGVAWYDGFQWTPVIIDSTVTQRRITKLSIGVDSNVLVVQNECLYIGTSLGFKKIDLISASIDRVISAVAVNDSLIAVTTYISDQSFLLYNIKTKHIQSLKYPSSNIRKTRSGRIFFGNSEGLFELINGDMHRFTPHGFARSISENIKNQGVLSMDSPHDQIGVWEWDARSQPRLSITERSLPVRALDISNEGDVIVAYETGDIRLRQRGRWTSLKPIPSQMIGLNCLFFDSEDNLWVGSENGLYIYRSKMERWSWMRYSISDPRNVVMEILESSTGDLWVGNMSGIELHKRNGSISQITEINGKRIGLVTGISEDNDGNIWISSGSSFGGAYQWNGHRWRHFGAAEGLKGPKIHKIRKDRSGNLWFLSLPERGEFLDTLQTQLGAYKYDGRSFTQYSKSEGLIDGRVYSFVETNDSAVWFGTKTGISRRTSQGWTHWDKRIIKNLSSIYAMDIDINGNLWFSTFSSVLGYIDKNDSLHWVWDWVTDSDYKLKIWDIKVDSEGVVWVATTKGLFSYSNGLWSNYDVESAFGLKELRVVRPMTDKVIVGGHGIGVGVFTKRNNRIPMRILIEKPLIESDRVLLKWTIHVYRNEMPPDDIEVRYNVDNGGWTEWSKIRETELHPIKSGNHRFELQVKDLYGNLVAGNIYQEFFVPPPYYLNPWIIIPFVILVLSIVSLIIRNKLLMIRHNKMTQDQRTRIANDLHDEVGSNLASVALISARLLKDESLPAVVKEQLSIIRETAAKTGDFLRDIVWYVNPRYDSFMSLETRLREIAGRMLQDQDVQIEMNNTGTADERFVESRRSIILMFKEIIHNIVKHAQASAVTIQCDYSRDEFLLKVKDNGVGFNPETTRYGSGLLSIKRRAREAGAELNIRSNLGEGTTITIIFRTNATEL